MVSSFLGGELCQGRRGYRGSSLCGYDMPLWLEATVGSVGALCTGTGPTLLFGAPVSHTGAGGDVDAMSSLPGVQSHVNQMDS